MIGENEVIENYKKLMNNMKINNDDDFNEDTYSSFDSGRDNFVNAFNKCSYLAYYTMLELNKSGELISKSRMANYYRKFKYISDKYNIAELVLSGLPMGCAITFEALTAFKKALTLRAYSSSKQSND